MMPRRTCKLVGLAALAVLALAPGGASAITVSGEVEPTLGSGQFMALKITIDDAKTTFEMTGPDFSWFAFGFDTTTMAGYSLIVQGTDGSRTAVEQNLRGIGNPGTPQAVQNISIVSTLHDEINDLTTIVVERVNDTGDANDPDFTPSMGPLAVIAAYDSFASPASPNPNLSFHGTGGRGFATVTFSEVPEPGATGLACLAAVGGATVRRRRRG